MQGVFAEPLDFGTHEIVVKERGNRQACGNVGEHGGRFKRGNDAEQIAEQHKEKHAADEGDKARTAVANVIVRLMLQEIVGSLENVLHLAGLIHGKLGAQDTESEDHDDGHQDLHDDKSVPRARLRGVSSAEEWEDGAEDCVAWTT